MSDLDKIEKIVRQYFDDVGYWSDPASQRDLAPKWAQKALHEIREILNGKSTSDRKE